MGFIRNALRRFIRDTRGTILVETVIVLPLVAVAFTSTYAIFDAFHTHTMNVRTAYTISDLLSRQDCSVEESHIDGMHDLFQILSRARGLTGIRISLITQDVATNRLVLTGESKVRGASKPALTQGTLSEVTARIPNLAPGDTAILVETWMPFSPMSRYLPLNQFAPEGQGQVRTGSFYYATVNRSRGASLPWFIEGGVSNCPEAGA